jgi:hypothetical protein
MNGYTYIAVAGQPTVSLNSTNNTLTLQPTGGITITTDPATKKIIFSTSGTISDLSVTNTLAANPAITGAINNVIIGATTPAAGTFNGLTALSTVNFNPANANITISPTGTGSVTINPTVTGNINNVAIGATTPAPATFTTLTATGNVTFNGNNANINISPTGAGVVTINPTTTGNINNVTVGSATPLSAKFTTVQMTTQPAGTSSAVTFGYAAALAAAYGMIMS